MDDESCGGGLVGEWVVCVLDETEKKCLAGGGGDKWTVGDDEMVAQKPWRDDVTFARQAAERCDSEVGERLADVPDFAKRSVDKVGKGVGMGAETGGVGDKGVGVGGDQVREGGGGPELSEGMPVMAGWLEWPGRTIGGAWAGERALGSESHMDMMDVGRPGGHMDERMAVMGDWEDMGLAEKDV